MHDLVADRIFDDQVFDLEKGRCRGLPHHAPEPVASLIGWKQAY